MKLGPRAQGNQAKEEEPQSEGWPKGTLGARILLELHEVIQCERIDAQSDYAGSWVARYTVRLPQVTEVPEVQPIVMEYQERCMIYKHCGHKTYTSVQLPLGESCYGPRLHAFVVSLNLESRLSLRQIQRLLSRA